MCQLQLGMRFFSTLHVQTIKADAGPWSLQAVHGLGFRVGIRT